MPIANTMPQPIVTPFLEENGLLDFRRIRLDPRTALRLPGRIALHHLALPLCETPEFLYVAFAGTGETPPDLLAELSKAFPDKQVAVIPAAKDALRRELRNIYGERLQPSPFQNRSAAGGGDDAVVLVENLLRSAVLRHASDLHVDPGQNAVRIRFRVDGILEDFLTLPSSVHAALLSRIKVLSGLDIAEKRAPQDGAFVWHRAAAPYDVRVATLPVRHGERATLRLLPSEDDRLSLQALGMSGEHRKTFERVLEHPYGLVLLTGPTGSGKTTTLYASIRHLLAHAPLNVLTVEDPVEYEMEGVAQCEVDSGDKVNFQKALRALLRHDPDVIMIGEIRDAESLDTAVKAALTGHLVLSTLHANNAVATVTRLADMGLSPHLIAATLRLSTAQRLVRRLCPHCHAPATVTEAQAALFQHPEWSGTPVFRPVGCPACAGRGFVGRIGLFELLEPDSKFASAIAAGTPEPQLRKYLADQGFKTLADDLLEKAKAGLVSLEEIAF